MQKNQLDILGSSFIVTAFILIVSFLLSFERVFPSLDAVPTRELVETQRGVVIVRSVGNWEKVPMDIYISIVRQEETGVGRMLCANFISENNLS